MELGPGSPCCTPFMKSVDIWVGSKENNELGAPVKDETIEPDGYVVASAWYGWLMPGPASGGHHSYPGTYDGPGLALFIPYGGMSPERPVPEAPGPCKGGSCGAYVVGMPRSIADVSEPKTSSRPRFGRSVPVSRSAARSSM